MACLKTYIYDVSILAQRMCIKCGLGYLHFYSVASCVVALRINSLVITLHITKVYSLMVVV